VEFPWNFCWKLPEPSDFLLEWARSVLILPSRFEYVTRMSPEWIPLLFAAAFMLLLIFLLRPRKQSLRVTVCRMLVMEAIYLGMCYLLLDVLEHPPAEALLGSILITVLAGAIPARYFQKLARER